MNNEAFDKGIVDQIKAMHLATQVYPDGHEHAGEPYPVTAPDAYVWGYYKQVRDGNPTLIGDALIAQVVADLDPGGDESGVIPSTADMRYAPAWKYQT
jgi:hypothetical protein